MACKEYQRNVNLKSTVVWTKDPRSCIRGRAEHILIGDPQCCASEIINVHKAEVRIVFHVDCYGLVTEGVLTESVSHNLLCSRSQHVPGLAQRIECRVCVSPLLDGAVSCRWSWSGLLEQKSDWPSSRQRAAHSPLPSPLWVRRSNLKRPETLRPLMKTRW